MSEPAHEPRRAVAAAALVVVGLAVIGLLAGTRESTYAPPAPEHGARPVSANETARPARSYTELMTRPWGLGQTHGAAIQRALTAPQRERVPATHQEARQAALLARAAHRAFSGAPPSIPHPVAQDNGLECLTCHEGGGVLGQALVPPMGHAFYTQCTQCHVPELASVPASKQVFQVTSSFTPLRGAPAPSRWSEAPPQLPHTSWMRERCESCHGNYGRHGLQTSHPERRSCLQCHAPSAVVEQMPKGVP